MTVLVFYNSDCVDLDNAEVTVEGETAERGTSSADNEWADQDLYIDALETAGHLIHFPYSGEFFKFFYFKINLKTNSFRGYNN